MLLRKGSLAKRCAEGHAEGTTCGDSETCQRFEGCAEGVFSSLGLKQNNKHGSHVVVILLIITTVNETSNTQKIALNTIK